MMLILSPFIILRILILQPYYTITRALQSQSSESLNLQNKVFSMNLKAVLLLRSAIDIFHIIFLGSIALSIYKNYHYNKEKKCKRQNFNEQLKEQYKFEDYFKKRKTILCVIVILLEDLILDQYLKNRYWNINVFEIIQNHFENKILDKVFSLIVFYFYKTYDSETSSFDFIALYQFEILSNFLRTIGQEFFQNAVDLCFWSNNDLQFVKIIFLYQIINASYIIWSSQIQRQYINNSMNIEDKLKTSQFLNVIKKLNKLTSPENNQYDQEYIGGFTRIIKKEKNEEGNQNSKKSIVKKNDDNICNFFIQILQNLFQNLVLLIEKQNDNIDDFNQQQESDLVYSKNNQIYFIPKDFNCHLKQDISPIHQEEYQQFCDFKQSNFEQRTLQNYIKNIQSLQCHSETESQQFLNEKTRTIIKSRSIVVDHIITVIHFQVFKKEAQNKQIVEIQIQNGFSQINIFPKIRLQRNQSVDSNQVQVKKGNEHFGFSFNSKLQNQIQENIKEESSKQSGQLGSSEANEKEEATETKYVQRNRNFSVSNLRQQFNMGVKFVSQHRQSVDVQKKSNDLQRSFSFGSTDFNDILPIIKKSEKNLQAMNQRKIEKEEEKKEKKQQNPKANAKKRFFKKLNTIDDSIESKSILYDSQIDIVINKEQNVENGQSEKINNQQSAERKKQKLTKIQSAEINTITTQKFNQNDKISSGKHQDDVSISVQQSNENSIQTYTNFSGIGKTLTQFENQHIKKSKSQFDFQDMIQYQDEKKLSKLQKLCDNLPKGKLQKHVKNELEQAKGSLDKTEKKIISNLNNQESVDSSQLPSSGIKDSIQSLKILDIRKHSGNLNKKKPKNKKGTKSDTLKQLIDHYENKIEQKETALEFFKKKVKDLEMSLESNKIFLNMAVHDMRNPTNQIEFLVSQTVKQLKDLRMQLQEKSDKLQTLVNQQKVIKSQNQSPNQIQENEPRNQIRQNKKHNNTFKQQKENSLFLELKINQKKSLQIVRQSDFILNNHKIKQNKKIKEMLKAYEKRVMELKEPIKQIDKQLCYQMQKRSKSLQKKKKLFFFEAKIQKCKSIQDNQDFKNENQLFKQVDLFKQDVIQDSTYVLTTIKNNIDLINNQKNQFYNRLNYLDKKQFQKQFQESYNEEESNQVFDQAFSFVQNIKNKLFDNSQSIQQQYLGPEQEPKIMKKKVKNLHLSFDASLLQQDLKQLQNNLKIDTLVNQIEIVIEKDVDNQIQQSQINQFPNFQIVIEFLEELQQNLDLSISSLENCKYCSVMLLNLINDMMDLAKSEKMKFQLNYEFFDLTSTIGRAFGTLSYFGQQKGIVPQLIVDSKIEPFFKNLKGDEGRFSQILLNFLSNAFKFSTENGSITIELCQADDQIFCQKKVSSIQQLLSNNNKIYQKDQSIIESLSEKQELQISINQEESDGFEEYYISFQIRIKDSGMGISRENINKLFLNFGKLADPSGCNKQGTGLGLSICKHLIEKMGGKVKVESEGIGKGTTFIIKMQAISKVEQKLDSEDQINLNTFSPQLPQAPNQEISQILQKQNEALQNAQNDSQSRKLSNIMDKLCISAQKTLHKDFMNQNSNLNQNNSQHEEKKIEIKRNAPSKKVSNKNTQLSIADAIKQLKVLIINDEFFILQMLKMMVKKANIEDIDTAQNGFDGFNMVIEKQYDFIICDLNMPVMDGFECAQKIKDHYDDNNQFFQQQKVQSFCPYLIACSAFITQEIEAKAISSGFELVVESPLTISILADKIIVKSLEKKAIMKKQNQIQIINERKLSKKISESSLQNNKNKKIQILIEKIDSKLKISQQINLKRKNSGHLHASLNDIDLMSDEESMLSQESNQQSIQNSNEGKINLNAKQSLGKISEVDEMQGQTLYELEDSEDEKRQEKSFLKKNSMQNQQIDQKNYNQNSLESSNSQQEQYIIIPNEHNQNLFNYTQQEKQNIIFQNFSLSSMGQQAVLQTPIFTQKKQIKRMNSKQLANSGLRKSESPSKVDSALNILEYQI